MWMPDPRHVDKDRLRELLIAQPNLTNVEAARIMNCDRKVVSRWRNRWRGEVEQSPLRQKVDSLPPDEEFIRMHEQRVSVPRQARMLGVTRRRVNYARHRLGLRYGPGPQPYPPETHKAAEDMLDDGQSFAEIQRTLGVGPHFMRDHFPGRGWTPEQSLAHMKAKRQAREAGIDL